MLAWKTLTNYACFESSVSHVKHAAHRLGSQVTGVLDSLPS